LYATIADSGSRQKALKLAPIAGKERVFKKNLLQKTF
jgi:hypothetical protein